MNFDFHTAMILVYVKAKQEAGYDAKAFLSMVAEHGGEATAHRLLAEPLQPGFTELWLRKRLDLTMEYLVLRPEWQSLFSEAELAEARRRLVEHGMVI